MGTVCAAGLASRGVKVVAGVEGIGVVAAGGAGTGFVIVGVVGTGVVAIGVAGMGTVVAGAAGAGGVGAAGPVWMIIGFESLTTGTCGAGVRTTTGGAGRDGGGAGVCGGTPVANGGSADSRTLDRLPTRGAGFWVGVERLAGVVDGVVAGLLGTASGGSDVWSVFEPG